MNVRIIWLISFFGGFFSSNILDTTVAEIFQDFKILGAALIVASLETSSNFFYSIFRRISLNNFFTKKTSIIRLVTLFNYLKIGIIYGLIVDAFKLGS